MKRGKGILFFTGILLLLLAAPLYAYQNVNGNPPSCLDCHASTYANNTTWHTSHQGYASNNYNMPYQWRWPSCSIKRLRDLPQSEWHEWYYSRIASLRLG